MLNLIARAQDMTQLCWTMAQLAADTHSVIAMRLMGVSGLWSTPHDEHNRMVMEKAPAFAEAALAATMTALSGHGPDRVMQAMVQPISDKARDNHTRLSQGGWRPFGALAPLTATEGDPE